MLNNTMQQRMDSSVSTWVESREYSALPLLIGRQARQGSAAGLSGRGVVTIAIMAW